MQNQTLQDLGLHYLKHLKPTPRQRPYVLVACRTVAHDVHYCENPYDYHGGRHVDHYGVGPGHVDHYGVGPDVRHGDRRGDRHGDLNGFVDRDVASDT